MNIVFGGDVCFCGNYRRQLAEGQPVFDDEIVRFVNGHHHGMLNFEAPETNAPAEKPKGIALTNPSGSIRYLKECGFDIFGLANNHLFDSGLRGYSDTIKYIWEQQGYHIGAGRNFEEASGTVTFRENGVDVVMLAFAHNEGMLATRDNPGVYAERDVASVTEQIMSARDRGFKVVVVFHGGEEYTRYPSPPKRNLFHRLAQAGAHAVVGHHSHTLQGYEQVGQCHCFYSLGNLVFDLDVQRGRPYINSSMLLSLSIYEATLKVKYLPVDLQPDKGMVSVGDQERFGSEFEQLCDFGHYKEHWQEEAYRVWFGKVDSAGQNEKITHSKSTSILRKLFKYSAYRRLFSILQNPYSLSLLAGALVHKFFRR